MPEPSSARPPPHQRPVRHAFVEAAYGPELARSGARFPVTYPQRPGNQAQVSTYVKGPSPEHRVLRAVVLCITAHRTVTMLTYKAARHGGTLHKVPAPGTSRRCSMCGFTTPGSRESQAVFVCKNEDCGWSDNADHNAARNVLHLYRMGHALVPAAGRAVVRRPRGVKPATAR